MTCLKVKTGKIYLENKYTNKNNNINEKDNWWTKKKGNNCGIICKKFFKFKIATSLSLAFNLIIFI